MKKVGALLLLAALLCLLGVPAQAATKTVTLSDQGPSPASLTLAVGDVVKFVNNGNSTHQIASVAGWSYRSGSIAIGASASTPAFTKAGTFTYDDNYTIVAIAQSAPGSFRVPGATPSPTPKPSATRTPSPTPKPSPGPSRSPTPSLSLSPTPAATSSGVAVAPGIGTAILPSSPAATPTSGPRPDIASPQPGPSGSRTPAATIAYGGKDGVVQGSPHRYGLPAALAVVGIVGVLSLLVRLLLAESASRRTA